MDLYSFVLANKEIFKIVYALIIVAICFLIVTKSNRFFQLSSHTGIRYFRNAFFFFGLAFASRYFLIFLFTGVFSPYRLFSNILFEFFLLMAGFTLLYSVMWRRLEPERHSSSSLFNSKISIFYAMSIIIVILDLIFGGFKLMFISQIILFLFLSAISYSKMSRNRGKNKVSKLYFLAMVLSLIAWILNAVVMMYFDLNKILLTNVYILNTIFFLLFLYGVIKATRVGEKNSHG